MSARTATLVIGPAQHGVVILARALSATSAWQPVALAAPDVPTLLARLDLGDRLASAEVVQVHFTDGLFADRCDQAADVFARLVRAVQTLAGSEVVVTLHDLPQHAEPGPRYERRAAAYRRVVDACRGQVIVSSEHEADQLRHFLPQALPHVVPLPIEAPSARSSRPRPDDDVAVLGFLYPGKGHAETLRALAALPERIGLSALGRPADGHDALAEELRRLATSEGRRFTVSGFLPSDQLLVRLRAARIPLVAHRSISASGSVGSWLTAGRRPLVPDGPYTRELEARCPGTVVRIGATPTALADGLRTAFADPGSTWLPAGTHVGPNLDEVAGRYAAVLATRPLRVDA